MFLREFFMPVTVVAFLVTFGKYFSVNWFGIFMPSVIGFEVLLFAFTGGVKVGELADQFQKSSSAPQPNKELLAARQRNAAQAEQAKQQVDGGEPAKKTPANAKQEKANAKKAEKAEKAAEKAAATAAKKTK